MGFKSVYRCLQEVFPQIDARILKAVAIEHSKDVDAAVNDVLTDVLPSIAGTSATQTNSNLVEHGENDTLLWSRPAVEVANGPPSSERRSAVGERLEDDACGNGAFHADITHLYRVDDAGPSSGPKCAVVEKSENSDIHADTSHLYKVDDAGPPSGPKCTTVEKSENNDCTNVDVYADVCHLYKVDDAGPSSGPKCPAFEKSENSDCTNSDIHADLTHLEEVVNARPSSEQLFDCENMKSNGSINGSFHADTHVTRWDEAVNESEALGSYIANDGDNQLVRNNMNGELLVLLGKTCEKKNELELSQNADVLSDSSEKKGTDGQEHINAENKASVSCEKFDGIFGDEQASFGMSPSSMNGKDCFTGRLNDPANERKDLECSKANDFDLLPHERNCRVDECVDSTLLDSSNSVAELAPPSVQVQTADATECELEPELRGDPPITDSEELQGAHSVDLSSTKTYLVGGTDSVDDDFTKNSTFTQSGQICSTDFLDEIIEEAKNNKKTLFSAMESVMNMMKEVELQERAAERAKEEAAMGGLDILVQVNELKQMLAHAKEGNDMHAGEVYGEKAILATEVRELQSRLLCLSDERDKSLAILDEMRQTLEARLAAAEESTKAAEQEKLEKEESARNAFAEQEAIMEKVVQESKLLEKEAEQNSKLREFLVDRGRVIDILQGEISVICQDARLLKEKFDSRVPLSMSVSSSQTTCKLASSGSSLKSMASVLAPEERESSKSPEKGSPASSIGDLTPKIISEDDWVKSDDKELLEDEWHIFDKDAELDL